MEDPKNTKAVESSTKSERPTAPKDAVVKAPAAKADPVAKATAGLLTKESVIDRPVAPKGAKKAPAKKAAAPKATAAKASKLDRPVIETGLCQCCGREEVLEQFEVVPGIAVALCVVCKTDVVTKAEAIKAARTAA